MMYTLVISQLNGFLNELASHVTLEKLKQMKFLLEDNIPESELEKCLTVRDVFSMLKKRCLIGEHNLEALEDLFNNMNLNNLTVKVQEFRTRTSKGAVKDIPQEQLYGENRTLPAPRQAVITLLIDDDYAEFKPQVVTHIRESLSQALGIAMKQVAYLLCRPYNSYYVIIQVPEKVVQSLRLGAVSQHYWLVNLHCLAVQINDSDPIWLQQESCTQSTMQVDRADQCDGGHVTNGNCQHPLLCNYQERNKVQVTFSFFGELYEDDVTLKHVDNVRLGLCANLNCSSSTELQYLAFCGGKDFALIFLIPECYLTHLKICCVECHRWLIDMNIVEIRVDREGQIFTANDVLLKRYNSSTQVGSEL